MTTIAPEVVEVLIEDSDQILRELGARLHDLAPALIGQDEATIRALIQVEADRAKLQLVTAVLARFGLQTH